MSGRELPPPDYLDMAPKNYGHGYPVETVLKETLAVEGRPRGEGSKL